MKPTCQHTKKLVFHNIDVVTPRGVLEDSGLVIEEGVIVRIGKVGPDETGEHIDACHHLVMPGFIDLHSDALEKYIEPRAGSAFPLPTAILEFDKTLAACGITTMYHCICFSYDDSMGRELRSNKMAATIINELVKLKNWLRVKTRNHIRFDILINKEAIPVISSLIDKKQVDLLSLMDHTPGQGQYRDTRVYRKKVSREWNISDDAIESMIHERMAAQNRIDEEGIDFLTRKASDCGVY